MSKSKKLIQQWLYVGCFMIFIMVMIGGITRLTGSGLSITEWDVVMGTLPPLSPKEWNESFEKYKQIPQYKIVNSEMTLSEFKEIFFWEYFHRLWGRLIGFVFLIPFIYFLVKKKFKDSMKKKMIVLFLLGGLQGFVGWFMVKSGLQDNISVSHFRLATHLLLALTLYSYVLYLAFSLQRFVHRFQINKHSRNALIISNVIIGILTLQIFYGALMAGLKAALNYPTYPKMNGHWLPSEMYDLDGFFANLLSNKAMIHVIHRSLPIALGIAILIFFIYKRKYKKHFFSNSLDRYALFMLITFGAQFVMGIFTVINSKGYIPLFWGTAHQAGAVVLLTACLLVNFRLRKGLSR